MGGRGQGPPRERATEGAERSEGAMPHRQFTIYFTTGCLQEDALGLLRKKPLAGWREEAYNIGRWQGVAVLCGASARSRNQV